MRSPALARAALALLLGVYLRVYSGGRRHLGHPLEGHDPAALDDAVARARDATRAEDPSRKLFLQKLHADYNLGQDVSVDAFVRAHRRHHLEDIKAAERPCASALAAAMPVAATATSPASSATSPSTAALAAPATLLNAKTGAVGTTSRPVSNSRTVSWPRTPSLALVTPQHSPPASLPAGPLESSGPAASILFTMPNWAVLVLPWSSTCANVIAR